MLKKKIFCPEFFCVLELFSFTLLKPLLVSISVSSRFLLLAVVLILFVLEVLSAKNIKLRKIALSLIVITICCLIFITDLFIRPNEQLGSYFYLFAIYGVIPMIMFAFINDFKKVLFWFTFLSIFVGAVFIFEPLLNYKYSGNYMSFGFEMMTPAFVGACVGVFIYKKKILFLLLLLFGISIIVFANKGSIITIFFAFFLFFCFSDNGFNWSRFFIVLVFCLLIFLFKNELFSLFFALAKLVGIRSYSLITIQQSINDFSDLFIGRNELWEQVIEYINREPFIGYGVGYLESEIGNYAHNLFLDYFSSFGVPTGLLISFLTFVLIIKIPKIADSYEKRVSMVFFVLFFFPLFFSMTFWRCSYFWLFIITVLDSKKTKKSHSIEFQYESLIYNNAL